MSTGPLPTLRRQSPGLLTKKQLIITYRRFRIQKSSCDRGSHYPMSTQISDQDSCRPRFMRSLCSYCRPRAGGAITDSYPNDQEASGGSPSGLSRRKPRYRRMACVSLSSRGFRPDEPDGGLIAADFPCSCSCQLCLCRHEADGRRASTAAR